MAVGETDGALVAEHGVAEDAEERSAADEAVIEGLLGSPSEKKKGALKRGFKTLPRTLPYLRPYRKLAIVSVLLTIILAVVALAEPWPLAFVVDSIIGSEPAPDWVTSIFGSSTGGLIALAVLATLLLTALAGGLEVWNEYLSTSVDQRMVLDLRSDMFQHAQKLSLAFHDKESKGILMYRINQQASAMGQIVTALPALAQSVLTLIGMAIISISINPLLALLALGTTPFVAYSTTFYTDRIEPRLYRVRGLGAINLAIVYEAMSMMRVVLAFGTQGREYTRFRKQGERFVDETVSLTVRQTAFKLAVQMITAAGTASVIGVGAYQAVQGEISAGELLVILSYISQIYQPLESLTSTITSFQAWFISLMMSFDLMDMKPEVTEKENAVPLKRARAEFEVDGVGFGYQGRPGVLNEISFKIPAESAVAIVGPTGAGKSTLVSLLPRFYDVNEGSIRIDGHDLRDLKLADLRDQFSIVLQEPLLFSGTIAGNIRYGKPNATMDEVIEAARSANAHDFISALPDGYETQLGERGQQISGGERQRIAVARAFLRDAPILILDEPTSSIDSQTEAVILDALDRLMVGRTTIVIAHRLSTLRSVDKIIVVDQGRIAQQGTHEELVGRAGLYQELWEAQTRSSGQEARAEIAPEEGSDNGSGDTSEEHRPVSRTLRPGREGTGIATGEEAGAPLQAPEPMPPAISPPAAAPSGTGGIGGLERPGRATAALPRPKIVLLGMLTKIPVGGVAWLVGHYAAGFERLGFEVYYVEAHARTPSMFMVNEHDDGAGKAAAYIESTVKRFGLEHRWAFQALHENGRCYGMSAEQLDRLYKDAALIINMHGGTLPLPEHAATDRLVFLGTDPVEVELEIERGDERALEFLDQHAAHFTWGLNYGNPDCKLPWAGAYSFIPSPPPVVLDFWENSTTPTGRFTTIGNWRQRYRDVRFNNRVFRWSKHQQFMKIIDLPLRTDASIELALSSYEGRDQLLLAEHGWRVRPGFELSRDLDSYRDYIVGSTGEISAAKEQNVHFRSGWFSERSVTYLAAGRPVIMQDTGFGSALPVGEGLFAYEGIDSAVAAIEEVQSEPSRHGRAARETAREYLSHDVVLGDMLEHVGLRRSQRTSPPASLPATPRLPQELSLKAPALAEETRDYILRRPVPSVRALAAAPIVTIVVPVLNNLACTRLALESILANTREPRHEILVVDDGSKDRTRQYLEVLASRNRHVRVTRNAESRGFVASCNEGFGAARGEILLLMTNDNVVPPAWLPGLLAHVGNSDVGLVTPTTNRNGGHAEVPIAYETYGELEKFAADRQSEHEGTSTSDFELAEIFCLAMRREVWEKVGPLAERPEIGTLEDEYASRVRDAGHRVVCADELFVHRFGTASPASLDERPDATSVVRKVLETVSRHVPPGSGILVASGGNDELLALDGYLVEDFPASEDREGPAADAEQDAIAELERRREEGSSFLVVPASSLQWLESRPELGRHLARYRQLSEDLTPAVIYELSTPREAKGSGRRTA